MILTLFTLDVSCFSFYCRIIDLNTRFLNNIELYIHNIFPSFSKNVCNYKKTYIHTFTSPPLITWNFVPAMVEFASRVWVIYDLYPFLNCGTFAADTRALSGIVLSLVKIATTRGTRFSPRARSDRRGRIRRWLPKDLVGYQENRRSLQHENGKEKGRKENPGRPGHKRMRWVNAATGEKRETQGEGMRQRKRDSWWGWCSWSTWTLLRVSRSVVLSVVFSSCPWRISHRMSVCRERVYRGRWRCDGSYSCCQDIAQSS